MSFLARHVLATIDQAENIYRRNPTLHAAQIRAGDRTGRDRTCLQLVAAAERLKKRQVPAKARAERDEVERIDRTFEDRLAQRAREQDRDRRLANVNERHAQRQQMDALAKHRLVLARAARMSTVKASNIAPSRAGADTPGGAPAQQLLDDDPQFAAALARLDRVLNALLEIEDQYEGLGTRAIAVAQMDGADKDRVVIDEGVGMTIRQFIDEFGRGYGSETYLRELRRQRGKDRLGYDIPVVAAGN